MRNSYNKVILFALAISTFSLGITEFISIGILPLISSYFGVSIPLAGLTVTFYALGVTLLGPFMTLYFAHYSKKGLILWILTVLLLGNIISALATSFTVLLIARVIASLSHGIFMAIGTLIATQVVPEEKKALSIAIMLSGLTISTIIGVPLGTFIGSAFGWRYTFVFIVGIVLIGILLIALFFPSHLARSKKIYFSDMVKILFHKRIFLIFLMTALGYGGTFVPFTYLSVILKEFAHFSVTTISWILVLYGAAVFIGNLVGGKLSGKNTISSLFWIFIFNAILLFILSMTISTYNSILILLVVLMMGVFAFLNVPGLQMYVMDQSKEHITEDMVPMASALNVSSFNLGIFFGSYLGQMTVEYSSLLYTGYVGGAMIFLSAFVAYILLKS